MIMAKNDYYQRITPPGKWGQVQLGELWRHRELLATLVKRDLQVRYKNTWLGVAWVILQPALSTLIFTLVFTGVFHFGNGNNNYPIYTLIGFTFWQFFQSCLTYSVGSMYEQANMIKKIYFPRAYIPLTIVWRQFFDWMIASVFLVAMMIILHTPITIIGITGYLLVMLALWPLATGCSLLVAAWGVLYRDVRHLVPFGVQIWYYLTPVFYARELLRGKLSLIGMLNPVTVVLDLARGALLEGNFGWSSWLILTGCTWLFLGVSLALFDRMEGTIIDRV